MLHAGAKRILRKILRGRRGEGERGQSSPFFERAGMGDDIITTQKGKVFRRVCKL